MPWQALERLVVIESVKHAKNPALEPEELAV